MFRMNYRHSQLGLSTRNGLCRWCRQQSKTRNGKIIYNSDSEFCSVECQEKMGEFLRKKERKIIKERQEQTFRGDNVEESNQTRPTANNSLK